MTPRDASCRPPVADSGRRDRCRDAVAPGEVQGLPDRPDLSGSSGRGVVLRHHTGRDAPAAADRDALLLGPCPDVAAALPAGRRARATLPSARPAGMLDEGRQLLAERA